MSMNFTTPEIENKTNFFLQLLKYKKYSIDVGENDLVIRQRCDAITYDAPNAKMRKYFANSISLLLISVNGHKKGEEEHCETFCDVASSRESETNKSEWETSEIKVETSKKVKKC